MQCSCPWIPHMLCIIFLVMKISFPKSICSLQVENNCSSQVENKQNCKTSPRRLWISNIQCFNPFSGKQCDFAVVLPLFFFIPKQNWYFPKKLMIYVLSFDRFELICAFASRRCTELTGTRCELSLVIIIREVSEAKPNTLIGRAERFWRRNSCVTLHGSHEGSRRKVSSWSHCHYHQHQPRSLPVEPSARVGHVSLYSPKSRMPAGSVIHFVLEVVFT